MAHLVDDHRRAEAALLDSEGRLRKAVAERTSELRRSEEELRDVIDTIPAIVWSALPDGSNTYVNSRLVEYSGMSAEQSAGSGWYAATHPDDLQRHVDKWHASVSTGEPFENEVRLRRADGQYRWHLCRGVPLRDEGGNIVKWYGVLTDIEDRKRTEQALQRSQFYLSEGQRLAHMGVWALNPSGFFEHWSHELFQIYGLDPQNGAPTLEQYLATVHPQDRDFMAETIRRMDAQRCGCDVKKRIVRSDGELRYIRCVAIPVIENEVLKRFLGTAMDVTEQELLTRESERRQAYLTEAQKLTHTGSWAFNPFSDKLVHWSDELLRIFGFDPQEGVPTIEELRNRIHPEDCDRVKQHPLKRFIEKLDDYRIVLPDGVVKHVQIVGHPILDETGELVEYVGTAIDVTERKRAEQERERLRQLESDLAHMNRLSIMGELAASLAHEITQPIATARNNARAALNFLDRSPPNLGEVREALACVVGDTDRAGHIVDRVRDHVKKAPPRGERFDLNEAINEVIVLARSVITGNGVSVRTRFTEGQFAVRGDRVQLQQVVLNLILNAVEAMSSIEAGARQLLISTEQTQTGGALVAVRDSGPGIDPERLERVFEPFFTTKSSGVGMGLSICRSIIDAQGGRLWAEANDPQGAVFQFNLPSAEGERSRILLQAAHQTGEPPEDTVLMSCRLPF